jgi:YD repeat-containing protein
MREIGFVIMTLLAAAILVFAAISYGQASEQQRFYDARGNSVGTASTDSQGTTTFRDAHGNTVGKRTRR